MGKGYNNYMTKKPFHPGSKANIKRTWMAEQKTENEKRKQEELKAQYDKEQDLYNNRALLSTESKEKLQLNFMYEAPPGAKRERQKEDDEPEFKFEWQRKYNAPREDYAKGKEEIRDQPFGIAVRNVRCIKCHKWGHINTDKECPLYTHASSSSMPKTTMDPLELMKQMREDGFGLKKSALGHQIDPKQANEQFIQSEDSDPEMEFLKSLSSKQKKKLLKKLNKLAKKQKKKELHKKKEESIKEKKKDKGKARRKKSDSDSDSEEEQKIRKRIKPEKYSSDEYSADKEEKPILKESKAMVQVKKEPLSPHMLSSKHHKTNVKKEDKDVRDGVGIMKSSEKSSIKIKTINFSKSSDEVGKKSSSDNKTKESDNTESTSKEKTEDVKSKSKTSEQSTTKTTQSELKTTSVHQIKTEKIKIDSNSSSSSSDADSSNHDESSDQEKKRERGRDMKKRSLSSSSDKDFHKPNPKRLATPASTSKEIDTDPSTSSDYFDKHPDGFDPEFPQHSASSSQNVKLDSDRDNVLHNRFRNRHRHRRSPSVKQKYRND